VEVYLIMNRLLVLVLVLVLVVLITGCEIELHSSYASSGAVEDAGRLQ
jgi:hypothetical protein